MKAAIGSLWKLLVDQRSGGATSPNAPVYFEATIQRALEKALTSRLKNQVPV